MRNQSAGKPLYTTVKQAAARYAVSVQLIAKLIKTGRLPACRLGRAIRIKLSDLEGAIEQCNTAAPKGEVQ
jgi:excisionase family DNA binding protein